MKWEVFDGEEAGPNLEEGSREPKDIGGGERLPWAGASSSPAGLLPQAPPCSPHYCRMGSRGTEADEGTGEQASGYR